MRTTSSIGFYCRQSKKDKKGYAPIEMSIDLNGDRKFINLPRKEKPEDFNKKRKSQDLQSYLDLMHQQINQIQTDLIRYGMPVTTENLREYLRTGGFKPYSISNLFEEFLKMYHKRIGLDLTQGSYRKYELVAEQFLSQVNKDAEVATINCSTVQNFYIYLQGKYDTATSSSYIAKLKTIIQYGIDNDKLRINPFQNLKVKRAKKEIDFLTEEEINKLDITLENQSLQRVLDCFKFQIYSGLAWVDMEKLTPEDIKEDNGSYYIYKNRVKTGVPYTAVLLPPAIEILKKYNYHLPVISNQKMNTYLKQIMVLVGIDHKLTTHLGRKTYGHIMLNKYSQRMEVVAKLLGHSSAKTTAKYYCEVGKDTILKEVTEAIK